MYSENRVGGKSPRSVLVEAWSRCHDKSVRLTRKAAQVMMPNNRPKLEGDLRPRTVHRRMVNCNTDNVLHWTPPAHACRHVRCMFLDMRSVQVRRQCWRRTWPSLNDHKHSRHIGYDLRNSNTIVCVDRGPRVGTAIPIRRSRVSYGYESEARLIPKHMWVSWRGGPSVHAWWTRNCVREIDS